MKMLITIVICLLLGFHFGSNKEPREFITVNRQKITNSIHTYAQILSPSETESSSEQENIEKTLRLVAENWKTTDINEDGKYNCIDAAVLFYQYYPDKKKVRIIVNRNSRTEMNHLFNSVYTDGKWKAIEPQAYASNHTNYFMESVWGDQYNKSFNSNVTSEYAKYAKK